jgi:hypothetical protein
MKSIHRGSSIAGTLKHRTDYIKDYDKTDDGVLVDSFECDVRTVDSEFLFSKRLYEQKTGRDQGNRDVIAYHVRMSFKPGEITAEQVLALGRELGLRWTRGRHQFIVAAHTNTNSPHAHITFNSVNLDCTGKYHDFKRSAIALRRVSDMICLEHGLSVIEKPGLSKGYNRAEYLGQRDTAPNVRSAGTGDYVKPLSVRGQLRDVIDSALPACKDFDAFLAALVERGVEIKRGKQLAFRMPGGKRFSRQDTLGDDYSYEAILKRIYGKRQIQISTRPATARHPNLLIDIQEKMQQGYGAGFKQWATIQNIKDMAKTLIYLQENKLDDYDLLTETAAEASARFNDLSDQIKASDTRLNEIKELQKYIGNYKRTLDVYKGYRDSNWSKKYYAEHESNIILHKATKKYFDSLGYGKDKKLPKMDALRQEYATLSSGKGKLYSEYKQARQRMIGLQTAKQNADTFLGIRKTKDRIHERGTPSL